MSNKEAFIRAFTRETINAFVGLYQPPYSLNVDYDKTKKLIQEELNRDGLSDKCKRVTHYLLQITNVLIDARNGCRETSCFPPKLNEQQIEDIKRLWGLCYDDYEYIMVQWFLF